MANRMMKIGGETIEDAGECFVIAEIGHNHQGNLEQCKKLFAAAKECGANAVKLQKRNNRKLYTKQFFDQPYNSDNSYGPTYGLHREALEFGIDEYKELKAYAASLGITFFSTAFDVESADFLESLDMPAYKVASGDLTNLPLIAYVASFKKPLVISTGGAELADVHRAVETVYRYHDELCVMQCTSGYPCPYEELNLRVIDTFRKEFPDAVIGYSGHDNGIAMAISAYTMGARMIEKHFTLDRTLKGTDHAFSLERPGLQKMIRDLKRCRVALGDGLKKRFTSESAPINKMAKSLVAARPIKAGETITKDDVAIRSPAGGMPPYDLSRVIGQVCVADIDEDCYLTYEAVGLQPAEAMEPATIPADFNHAPSMADRVARVRLVALDFDGVLTDNKVYVSQDGVESVACSRADGLGLTALAERGVTVVVVSTETNPVVAARCKKLGLRCLSGVKDKRTVVESVAREHGLSLAQVAFVGNDVNDRDVLAAVGLPIVVQDAHPAVIGMGIHQTTKPGGHGAVREVCDWLIERAVGSAGWLRKSA